jgi:hypothetical protein
MEESKPEKNVVKETQRKKNCKRWYLSFNLSFPARFIMQQYCLNAACVNIVSVLLSFMRCKVGYLKCHVHE